MLGLGVIAVLVLVLFAGGSLLSGGEDPAQVAFAEALAAQSTAIELSDLAAERSADPDLRNRASIITATIGSDVVVLTPLYQQSFGELTSGTDEAAVTELDQAGEGFEQLYRQSVLEALQTSAQRLEYLKGQIKSQEFQAAVNQSLQNHTAHIAALEQ